MSEIIPNKIKYCFATIIKEALSNVIKHSNATAVKIVLREHPALYQLCIEDNGKGYSEKGSRQQRNRIKKYAGTGDITWRNLADQWKKWISDICRNSKTTGLEQ